MISSRINKKIPWRVVLYGAMTGTVVLGFVLLGWYWRYGPFHNQNTLNGARLTSSTRDRFQEVYDLAYRADGNAGNTAVDALYVWPGLVQRLTEYAERSSVQAEMLQLVQSETDASLVPIWITLESNAPLPRSVDWKTVATLDSNNARYVYERFDVSSFPSGRDTIIAGLLWFRRTNPIDPDQLTLTIKDVQGNIKPSLFTWDTKALRLYADLPAAANN